MNLAPLIRYWLTAAGSLLWTSKARAFEQSRNWRAPFCPAQKRETKRVSCFIFGNDVMAETWRKELLSSPYDPVHVFDPGGVMWIDAKDHHDTANAKGLTDVYAVARWRDPGVVLGLNWIEFRHQII